MKNIQKLIFIGCACLIITVSASDLTTSTKDDHNSQKELLQMQMDFKKELMQKTIEFQNDRISAFEKRLDDQVSRVSDISGSIDRFGIIVSVLGILITLVGAFVYLRAKIDAEQAAKEAAKKWFEENSKSIEASIKDLQNKYELACGEINSHTQKVVKETETFSLTLKHHKDLLEKTMESKSAQSIRSHQELGGAAEIERRVKELKKNPEDSYTFDDWSTRAFAAYYAKNMNDAIFYWGKALQSPGIEVIKLAEVTRFKCYALRHLNRIEEADALGNALIEKWCEDTRPAVRTEVAKTMFAKFNWLNNADYNEQADMVYNEIISIYCEDTWPDIVEVVANVLNNKGISLLYQAKAAWGQLEKARTLLTQAQQLFFQALKKYHTNGIIYGNLAYIEWLQGDSIAADKYFRKGLVAENHGGEELYSGTLDDISIHTIDEDHGYEKLVNKLWVEYQQKDVLPVSSPASRVPPILRKFWPFQ